MMKSNCRSDNRKKKIIRILVVALACTGAAILIALGVVYAMVSKINLESVPIVSASPGSAPVRTAVPTPDLPEITGEPDDIGEDYDEPDPTGTASAQPADEPIYRKIPIKENVINILVLGQDLRPGESGRGRSDTMMILSYNRAEGKASLVSLMRDTWVPINGHAWNRLNAAFRFGGAGLAVNTINDLFDLDVQNYIIVNFEGMRELVDTIGGIDVNITDIEAAFYNKQYGWGISSGRQHLNGEQALVHARNRKSNGGDFERVRRQQDIMMAVYKRLMDAHDPVLLSNLIGFTMNHVQTNLSADAIFTMGLEVIEKGGIEIQKGRVPADKTWKYANQNGRSVISIDFVQNTAYLRQLIYNEK